MGFNFPNTPTVGDLYPVPPTEGVPQYRWDGEKWSATTLASTAPVPPFESTMAYSGMQINGGMEVSQENGTTEVANTGIHICDGWKLDFTAAMLLGGGVAAASNVPGIGWLLYTRAITAQASMGANDYAIVRQFIEGWRIARLGWGTANAQPITISFWTRHARSGLYSITVRNGASDRSYAATYTHNVADVAQYNTIAIPGDTSGTWATGNTIGINLTFAIAAGTSLIAPSANTWVAGNYAAAPGQINGVAATSDIFRITGVTVLPGTQAPTAAQSPNIMRPYDQELVTCQRYFQKFGQGGGASIYMAAGYASVGEVVGFPHPYMTLMRATPTASMPGGWNFVNVASGSLSIFPGLDCVSIVFGPAVAGNVTIHTNDAAGCIQLNARL